MLTSTPASDALTGMFKVLVAFGTDLTIRSSGGVETDDVVGGVESVKILEVKGMEI